MQYDAITLDANIFRDQGFYLEGGLLGQLSQFKEGSAQFVLSEIVIREVLKHLRLHTKEARDELGRAVKEGSKHGLFLAEAVTQLNQLSNAALSAEDASKKRLQAFLDRTGAILIRADAVNVKELIKRYFAPSPPFEASGKKKHEFPDAIALLSLEDWAKSSNKKILAISKDSGWHEYANTSDWIDAEKDLAAALQKLQKHVEQAEAVVGALLAELDAGKRPEVLRQVTNGIADAVSSLTLDADATAAYHYEADSVEMTFQDFRFLRPQGEYEFTIVQIGNHKIVAGLSVHVQAEAKADFSFSIYDSEDKDYLPIGSNSAETEVEFDALALVTFEGDFSGTPTEIAVTKVEIVHAPDSVDFGHVDMDYGEPEYEDA